MDNFDLKKFLYNKSLLTEGLDLKASPMESEVEETTTKMSKSALKEKIRSAIMDTLSEEDTMDETEDDVKEGFGKTLKNATIGALAALGIKKYGIDVLNKIFSLLPPETAQEWSDIIQTYVDMAQNIFEADEDGDDLDAALDAAEDEIGDEAPVGEPADEPAGPELSDEAGLSDEETDIQSNLKKAYDNAVSIGDEKLANQIANTITFFTRAHVVPRKD